MKNNKTLLSYVFGMLTVIAFIPILSSLVDAICGYIEILKIHSGKIVVKGNKEITEIQIPEEEVHTQAIGFRMPDNEEYYDDFEDKKKNNIKLGFH